MNESMIVVKWYITYPTQDHTEINPLPVEGRKEMFYLMIHWTHGYLASISSINGQWIILVTVCTVPV